MSHIVNECPLMKFPGGLQALHSANEDSITNYYHMASQAQHTLEEEDIRIVYSPGAEGGSVCNHMSPNFDS